MNSEDGTVGALDNSDEKTEDNKLLTLWPWDSQWPFNCILILPVNCRFFSPRHSFELKYNQIYITIMTLDKEYEKSA